MATDTTVNNLIINKLTKEQYEAIANPSVTELYLIPDEIDDTPTSGSENPVTSDGIYSALEDKQDTLVSGTNIKTINNTSVLGSGNISVGTYSKPSGGIPKTDLESEVQTSLGLADTALQSFTESDPTVPSWAKASSKPSYSYSEISDTPTLGTAAALNVPANGNASTTEVVKGDDTRLSDARNAADVYSWAKAATKPSYSASEVGAIPSTDKGANGGVAELDSSGKVPSSQLPSFVDDVVEAYYNTTDHKMYEESTYTTAITPTTGKIYVDLNTNKTYRWSGTAYVEISESLALGETSSTAYAGNKGKANADAIAAIKDGTSIDSFGDVETALSGKQATLVGSGTGQNVKTVNNNSIVGSGNISVGDVTGPSSSTDSHVATFNGAGGKTIKDSGYTIGKSVPSDAVFTDTTYESKTAASGGTAVSLCTTGEKYTWNNKQASLVSGTNIKTINSISLLGSGNISVQPTLVGSGTGQNIKTINSTSIMGSGDITVQPTLVSGVNIKTINNESILGSGNITIQGGGGITGTGVTAIVALTESEYEALTTKSATTIYIVTPDPENTNYIKLSGSWDQSYIMSPSTGTVTEVGSGYDYTDLSNLKVYDSNDVAATNEPTISGSNLVFASSNFTLTIATASSPSTYSVSGGGGGNK